MNTSDYSILTDLRNMKANDPRNTFQIIEQIGEGTYGRVFKALNKITDQLVAIKICQINEDEQVFYNELESLRTIEHPFIVRLLDACRVDDELWLILEYCQLGSVADTLKITKKPFTEPEIACICFNILLALDYLHKKKRMHRDIKPANLLINHVGHVKLTDFGIATAKNHTNTFIGSPLWMAPEQAAKKHYTSNVDIWAIGICIFEMAELYTPFQQLHYVRVLQAIQARPQTTFRDPSKFSAELNNFMNRCLEVDPAKRATAAELLEHPFILKYKPRFTEIRIQFYKDKKKVIEESRLKRVLQNGSKEYTNVLEDFLVTDKENSNTSSYEVINTKGRSMQSEIITVIEKSLVESSQGSLENCVGQEKSQLYLAIKSVQHPGNSMPRGSVKSLSIKIKGSNGTLNQKVNNSFINYSSKTHLSGSPKRDVICEGGSFLKISSKIQFTNYSTAAGSGIPQHCKESLGRCVRVSPFFHSLERSPSPILTHEGEDNVKRNANLHTCLKYPSEKFSEKNSRLNPIPNEALVNMNAEERRGKHKKKYKHINVSNFIVRAGRQSSPHDSPHSSLDSEISCYLACKPSPQKMLNQEATKQKQNNKKTADDRRDESLLHQDSLIQRDCRENDRLTLNLQYCGEDATYSYKPRKEFENVSKNREICNEIAQTTNQFVHKPTLGLSPLNKSSTVIASNKNFNIQSSYVSERPSPTLDNIRNSSFSDFALEKYENLFLDRPGAGRKTFILKNEIPCSCEEERFHSKTDTFGRLTFEPKISANCSDRRISLEEQRTANFNSDPTILKKLFANETEKSIGYEPAQIIDQDVSFKDIRFHDFQQ